MLTLWRGMRECVWRGDGWAAIADCCANVCCSTLFLCVERQARATGLRLEESELVLFSEELFLHDQAQEKESLLRSLSRTGSGESVSGQQGVPVKDKRGRKSSTRVAPSSVGAQKGGGERWEVGTPRTSPSPAPATAIGVGASSLLLTPPHPTHLKRVLG